MLLLGQDCESEPPAPEPGEDPYCYGSPTVYKYVTDAAGDIWAIMRGDESTDRRATLRVAMSGGYCTGVVYGPHTFLTAGHCTWGQSTVNASLGGYSQPPYWNHTSKVEHPEYAKYRQSGNQYRAGRYWDVSVVQVGLDRTETEPLPEPYVDGFFDFENDPAHCVGMVIQGWGQWEGSGLSLREAPYQIDQLNNTSVRSLVAPDEGAICFGDSGGPLYAEMDDGSLKLVGLTSTTDSQDCLVGNTHARVDTMADWIEANK